MFLPLSSLFISFLYLYHLIQTEGAWLVTAQIINFVQNSESSFYELQTEEKVFVSNWENYDAKTREKLCFRKYNPSFTIEIFIPGSKRLKNL